MPEQVVLLSELERDLPAPPAGWAAELDRRGVAVVADDLGRVAVDRATARALFSEHREQQVAAARKREEVERQAIEKDRQFRASLPAGIPARMVPGHLTAAEVMVAGDPMDDRPRRKSVLETALDHPAGFVVYTPINEDAP
jgi:hypothetical protein